MKKNIIIFSSVTLILLLTGFLSFNYFKSPKYTIKKIGNAIENHNYPEFEKLVDVKDLSNNFIDSYIEEEGKDSEGIVELMRDMMINKFSSEIKNLVENTENEGKKEGVSKVLNKSFNLKSIESSDIHGNIATLNLNIGSEKLDTTFILVAKMRKLDKNWQLFKFDNLSEFIKTINEREKLLLKKKNKLIKEEIKNALSYEDSKTSLIKKSYSYYIVVENTYKNTSNKSIKGYSMIMEILKNGNNLISLDCDHDWSKKPIEPNELITESLIFEINNFENSELVNVLTSNEWDPKYIDKKLVFTNGDSLSVVEKL